MTTSAANDMFLPPLTTLVTRLIETTWSFRLNLLASSFFVCIAIFVSIFPVCFHITQNLCRIRGEILEVQTSLACSLCQSLHATVIQIAAAIEDHLLDALLLRL